MTDVLKFSVPGKPEYIGTIRLAVSSLANCAGFDIEAVEDIKVAVSEACSNVVCHGKPNREECYEVACEIGRKESQFQLLIELVVMICQNIKTQQWIIPRKAVSAFL